MEPTTWKGVREQEQDGINWIRATQPNAREFVQRYMQPEYLRMVRYAGVVHISEKTLYALGWL